MSSVTLRRGFANKCGAALLEVQREETQAAANRGRAALSRPVEALRETFLALQSQSVSRAVAPKPAEVQAPPELRGPAGTISEL